MDIHAEVEEAWVLYVKAREAYEQEQDPVARARWKRRSQLARARWIVQAEKQLAEERGSMQWS